MTLYYIYSFLASVKMRMFSFFRRYCIRHEKLRYFTSFHGIDRARSIGDGGEGAPYFFSQLTGLGFFKFTYIFWKHVKIELKGGTLTVKLLLCEVFAFELSTIFNKDY